MPQPLISKSLIIHHSLSLSRLIRHYVIFPIARESLNNWTPNLILPPAFTSSRCSLSWNVTN